MFEKINHFECLFAGEGSFIWEKTWTFLCSCKSWNHTPLPVPFLKSCRPPPTYNSCLISSWLSVNLPDLKWCLLLHPAVHLWGKQMLLIIGVIWILLFPETQQDSRDGSWSSPDETMRKRDEKVTGKQNRHFG